MHRDLQRIALAHLRDLICRPTVLAQLVRLLPWAWARRSEVGPK